ncbi:SDR family oxidoreductase [Streptomyces nitrosporeus]|uniref:SDR family oxidoreductase n=1 Tax=Streptomyces nitrosporeus TaxID=28894 RepID=A0A5J6F5I3_9ACTN|nr:SDR family oxidoreductase [Streptomyces nitrosporeus]QEU71267.1 SDR family oxidoreductase [Streptomyces nitrosporeus]GGY99322.1 oxidoreductase [Streptomyces nitrosporeus]
MDLGLSGRCYLVTAGSSGLGFATAQALLAEGADVVICSRDARRVDRAAARLTGAGRVAGVAADLLDPATADRLVGTALHSFGRLDGALLGTGSSARGTVLGTADTAWREHFELLFLSMLRCARAVAAPLPSGGAIAFLLSTSARAPLPGFGISTGLRPGLAMAAKSLAAELGPRGIRVLSMLPGRFPTEGAPLQASESPRGTALRRYGRPEEFGRIAAFCLSPAAGYLTGCEVVVDGGKQ